MRDKIKYLVSRGYDYPVGWYMENPKRLIAMYLEEFHKEVDEITEHNLKNIDNQVKEISKLYYLKYNTHMKDDLLVDKRLVLERTMELTQKEGQPMNVKDYYNHIGYHAYIDGSFNNTTYVYGSGIVFICNNSVFKEVSLKGDNPILAKQRNVAGEMRAAMGAVSYCLKNSISKITLHYDYTGIEAWTEGTWKRNNDFTKKFHEFMNDAKHQGLQIIFRKVKAHSDIKYNDRADELAKEACGL